MEPAPFPLNGHQAHDASGTVIMVAVLNAHGQKDIVFNTNMNGYLLEGNDPLAMLAAITEMRRGGAPLLHADLRKVMLRLQAPDEAPVHPGYNLSERERDVLRELVGGLSYKMIADKLFISFETVRTHIKRIYEKLGVHNSAEAVAKTLNGRLLA